MTQQELPFFHINKYAPPHLSAPWIEFYETFVPFWRIPDSGDLEGFRQLDEEKQQWAMEFFPDYVDKHDASIRELELGGVRVIEITPRELRHENKALMYMHGGGWYSFSPETTFVDTVPMADRLGVRVYSVDYEKVPFATLHGIVEQNIGVFSALVNDLDLEPANIGIYGGSAGGHLSLAVPYNLRERGIGLPGVAVACSPMVDFTLTNDTWWSLEGWDPVISREAYARPLIKALRIEDPCDPFIAPQFGDLSKGMPPTLIQTGGKELLLSDSLVIYQALEQADQTAKLDVYDGLPHCFAMILPDTPEAQLAIKKQANWFTAHLRLD